MPLDEVCSIISPHRLQYTRDDKRLACQAFWMPPWQLLHTNGHCVEAVDLMCGLAMNISKAVGLYFGQRRLRAFFQYDRQSHLVGKFMAHGLSHQKRA